MFLQKKTSSICGFGQRVRCMWRNKEQTPKGEGVKLITQWKHVQVVFFYVLPLVFG